MRYVRVISDGRNWTPEETSKVQAATNALGEHAKQRREREQNVGKRDIHRGA